MRIKLSPNAEKALQILYIGQCGFAGGKRKVNPVDALAELAGISRAESYAAFLELEAKGLAGRHGPPKGIA